MATGARENLYAEVDAEIERLRSISTRPVEAEAQSAIVIPHPNVESVEPPENVAAQPVNPGMILDNIQRLTLALRTSHERAVAAEERAKRAEARANEAERWLRRLHQAVQEAMRMNKPS